MNANGGTTAARSRWPAFAWIAGAAFSGWPSASGQMCAWELVGHGLESYANALAVHDEDGPGPLLPRLFSNRSTVSPTGGVGGQVMRFDGAAWTPVGPAMNRRVNDLESFDDGAGPVLYAGGEFSDVGGATARALVRWDGSAWHEVGGGATFTSTLGVTGPATIAALAVANDGAGLALFVGGGGFFNGAGGAPVGGLARWDGSSWSNLGLVPQTLTVTDIIGFDDGSGPAVYVTGAFALIGGVPVQSIARWNGSVWSAVGVLPPGAPPALGGFRSLAVFNDGGGPALYLAGSILNLSQGNHLLKWTGAAWSLVGPGENGVIHRLAVFDGGGGPALFATGAFTSLGGLNASGMARWDGAAWTALGSGTVGDGPAMIPFEDAAGPALVVAGISAAGGVPMLNIAAWRCPPACDADCNTDGALTVADFGCFQTRFVAAEPYADCNASGTLTVADFGCFQSAFVAGCP